MTDFYSQNRCVCSTRSHGPLLCAFCLSFHFKVCLLVVLDIPVHVLVTRGVGAVAGWVGVTGSGWGDGVGVDG